MFKIPYASAVGSFICVMIYTWLDIANAIGVVSRFLSNLEKAH